jgi:hypothetical protein
LDERAAKHGREAAAIPEGGGRIYLLGDMTRSHRRATVSAPCD